MKKRILAVCLMISITAAQASNKILRGPYIQDLQKNSAVIRWKTKKPTITLLKYSDSQNTYQYQDRLLNKEHLVRLINLKAATGYEYAIYAETSTDKELSPELNSFFITQASSDTDYQTHMWILGDPGTSSSKIFDKKYRKTQVKVRDAYYQYCLDNHIIKTDLILTLGDNVYDYGSEKIYNKGFFKVYQQELAHIPVYTTFGNHDAGLNRESLTFQARSYPYPSGIYYDIFTSPEKKSAFYSFNQDGVHIIVLDSQDSFWEDFDGSNYEKVWIPGSNAKNKMLDWLKLDLEANHSDWTIVTFHHPPFAIGGELHEQGIWQQWIKVNVVPILEQYHVDLVLSGHVHNYQRTYPLTTFQSQSKLSIGEPVKKKHLYYPSFVSKQTQQLSLNISSKVMSQSKNSYTQGEGIIYVILGSSGAAFQSVKKDLKIPFLVTAMQKEGSLILDANAKRLQLKFLSSENKILDEFTIDKNRL